MFFLMIYALVSEVIAIAYMMLALSAVLLVVLPALIGRALVFESAGKPFWASFVPFLDAYAQIEIARLPKALFWVYLGCWLAGILILTVAGMRIGQLSAAHSGFPTTLFMGASVGILAFLMAYAILCMFAFCMSRSLGMPIWSSLLAAIVPTVGFVVVAAQLAKEDVRRKTQSVLPMRYG